MAMVIYMCLLGLFGLPYMVGRGYGLTNRKVQKHTLLALKSEQRWLSAYIVVVSGLSTNSFQWLFTEFLTNYDMVLKANILTSDTPLSSPIPILPCHEYVINCVKDILPNLPKDAVYLTDWTTKKSISYSEIIPLVSRLSSRLRSRGFQDGDVVCMYTSNHVDFPLMTLAIWQSRGVFTGIPISSSPSELADRCKDAGVRYICCDKRRAQNAIAAAAACDGQIREIWVMDGEVQGCVPLAEIMDAGLNVAPQNPDKGSQDVDLDAVVWIPYSSGTTGLPKGILHTHKTLVAKLHILRMHGVASNAVGPCAFINFMVQGDGLLLSLLWMSRGLRCVTLAENSDLDLLKAIVEFKVKHVSAFPPQLAFVTRDPVVKQYDLSSVEHFSAAGSTWNVDDEANIAKSLPNVKEFKGGFGMTEIGMVSTTDLKPVRGPPLIERKLGSSGWLYPGTSLKVVDGTTGAALGPLQEGEIFVQTSCMMKGYLNLPEATAKFFKDNWARTGDEGYFDETGQLFISGRIKELIKYKDSKVAPAKLETIIKSLDTVADACVVGIPHVVDGEHPAAAVVLKPGTSPSAHEIQQFVDGRTDDFAKLRGGVFIMEKIPYNDKNKPLRRHVLKEITELISKTEKKL